MSYILDALRKSEQERQRGSTPSLDSIHVPVRTSPQRRSVWPWLFALALLVNAGILAWWMGPWHAGQEPATDSTQSLTATPSSPEKAPHAVPSNGAAHSSLKPTPAGSQPSLGDGGSEKSASQASEPAQNAQTTSSTLTPGRKGPDRFSTLAPKQPPAPPAPAQPRAGPSRPIEPSKPDTSSPAGFASSQPAAPPKTGESLRSEDQKRTAAKPAPPPSSSPAAVQPSPKAPIAAPQGGGAGMGLIEDLKPLLSETRPARKEPEYHSIPGSMKSDIPKLSLSFLVYSEKPEERRVTINGKVLREGDEVSDGLKLERITHEGAVFNYKGFQFHKGVF